MTSSSCAIGADRCASALCKFCIRVGSMLLAAGLLSFPSPEFVWACACGCSVFDVGTPSLLPNGAGGTVWLEYDFANQYINYHHTEPASAGANSDHDRDRELSKCKANADHEEEQLSACQRAVYQSQAKNERGRNALLMILTTSRPR
jgi:hypothetical protein